MNPHPETQYLDALRRIRDTGVRKTGRNGDTISLYDVQMSWPLVNDAQQLQWPLLTTKSVFWRGAAEELMWMLRGETDSNILSAKGVKIWDANGTREALDSRGLTTNRVGDLGPVYGFQWRHFGAEYKGPGEYTGQGVDQIAGLIYGLRRDPYGRRHIVTAWNPAQIDQMALPPCHVMCHFFVDPPRVDTGQVRMRLSAKMLQRSADMPLGVPFNIAGYTLLLHIVAKLVDMEPGTFYHTLDDAHIYANQLGPIDTQLAREPLPFPRLELGDFALADLMDPDFVKKYIRVVDYRSHERLDYEFSA